MKKTTGCLLSLVLLIVVVLPVYVMMWHTFSVRGTGGGRTTKVPGILPGL